MVSDPTLTTNEGLTPLRGLPHYGDDGAMYALEPGILARLP